MTTLAILIALITSAYAFVMTLKHIEDPEEY
jgi:hypothetical protein